MALDAQTFVRRHPFFSGRDLGVVEQAIAWGRTRVSLAVCQAGTDSEAHGEELYESIVEAEAEVRLLSDQTGLPTSKTRESGLLNDAIARRDELRRLVPVGFGVAVPGGRVREWP